MLVPYHVSIDVEKVRAGFSRLVQDTQQELIRLGYSIGNADGINGRKTREAIAHVQAQLGREQDGQASEELLSLLRKATPAR
jgi:peptidoglycan hydrolase-like protein with peptidoglycan-binding domain